MPEETNDEIVAELYAKTTKLLSGYRSRDELKALFKEMTNNEPPDTTPEWLKEAIVREYQRKFYEQRGVAVPEIVKKNDSTFFSTPVPALDPNSEKKEKTVGKIEHKSAGGEAKERKNKTGESKITLKADANIDDIIKKQKTEHVVAMMNVIKTAGAKGITIAQLAVEVPKLLKDKTVWEKYKPAVHINYVIKKLMLFVDVTTPA